MTTDIARSIHNWLGNRTRAEVIHGHKIRVPLKLWAHVNDLPGAPVTGAPISDQVVEISRGQIFDMADEAVVDETGEAALRMLWHSLAWGTGADSRNWNNAGRADAVRSEPGRVGKLLRKAAIAARTDPERAFGLLSVHGKTVIPYLGPNFFTKFLYFAGTGKPEHPCLIVDKRVLATLHARTGDDVFNPRGSGYGYYRYEAALSQLHEWANEASTFERTIVPDEVEMWAFKVAGR